MSEISCFFNNSKTRKLYGKYMSKHMGSPISLERFNTILSQLQSDSNINFKEWIENDSDSNDEKIISSVYQQVLNTKEEVSNKAIVPPDSREISGTINSFDDVVRYSDSNGFVKVNPDTPLSSKDIESLVEEFISSLDLDNRVANNIRNNIKSLAELQTFALFFKENEVWNDTEVEEGKKYTKEKMAANAIMKLNSYAKINEGLKELRSTRPNTSVPNIHKGIIQTSDFKKNGYMSANDINSASNSTEAYRSKTDSNVQNTDATLIICPWESDSPGERRTRIVASKDNNDGKKKIIADIRYNTSSRKVAELAEKSLKERGDLDLSKGITLNIAGNSINKIIAKGSNQEEVNKYVYNVLKELSSRVKINQVVTGGQTGIDEAGIIAAAALGIPYRIHTAAYNSKYGIVYPLVTEEGPTSFFGNNENSMNKYLNRFNREAINKVKDIDSKKSNAETSKNTGTSKPGSSTISEDKISILENLGRQILEAANSLRGTESAGTNNETQVDSGTPTQDIMENRKKEINDKIEQEEYRIKSEMKDINASPVAKLHRAIGGNSPQIIQYRMNMFAINFSYVVDDLVAEYKTDYLNKSKDKSLDYKEQMRAFHEYVKASDADTGRAYVISKMGNVVLQRLSEEFKNRSELLDDALEDGEITEEQYSYQKYQWQVVQEHFDTIFSLAAPLIERNENIKVKGTLRGGLSVDKSSEEQDFEDEANEDNTEGEYTSGNEGWAFKTREVDPHVRMSQAVKKILRGIVKGYYTKDGFVSETDDLGQEVYYQEDQLYAILVKEFSKIKEPLDFCVKKEPSEPGGEIEYEFPLLDPLTKKYPWVNDVIDLLDESLHPNSDVDDEVKKKNGEDPDKISTQTVSLFYSNFRNDFIPYYMNKDGKSIALNVESAEQSTLDVAMSNIDHGNILNEHSIYNTLIGANPDNIEYWIGDGKKSKISNIVKSINEYLTLSDDEIESAVNDIIDLFKSLGIPYSTADIAPFISTDLGRSLIKDAINSAKFAIKNIADNPEGITIDEELKKNLKSIGKSLNKVYEEYVQQSFREGDKTRYSYSTPNYIDTMVKYLNQSNMNKRHEYLLDTYGKTEWFYDKETDTWKNEVLQRLWDGEKVAFSDVKDLLSIEFEKKHEYSDWTPLDISAAFFTEYYQNNDSDKEELKMSAFYNFPIFSDSPICKLVKMKRYTGTPGSLFTSDFRTELLPKFVNIAEQELWRIKLVREREENNVEKIANFDTRGKKFCFFPYLNNMDYNNLTDCLDLDSFVLTLTEDEAVLDNLKRIIREKELSIDNAEETLRELYKADLLERLNSLAESTNKSNPTMLDLIEEASLRGDDYLKRELLKLGIANGIQDSFNSFVNSNSEGLAEGIESLISSGKLSDKGGEEGSGIVPLYINEIAEYFWNSCFATANIIQLTTTDLAFYKNGVDFQKRYKQVYASGTKLNTQSKYGKTIENTIYLRDNIMTVPTYDALKTSLEEAVKNKDLHQSEMDAILSNYRDITQTDAQAYRSIKSVRDVLDMLGQLSPAMEDMLNRMINQGKDYKYNYSDFNTIIQTIKPFFFGHDTIDSGVEKAGLLRIPHQNKNSEFTLLSSIGTIAAVMRGSEQLRALNDFMLANDIDVAQFESAVKVGGQGIIDINWSPDKVSSVSYLLNNSEWQSQPEGFTISTGSDIKEYLDSVLQEGKITSSQYNSYINELLPSYSEVMSILNDRAKNTDGSLKEEVVHQHRYDDYMIATATPEHFFDTEAIYGSQFRNIIISDINDDDIYTINGKEYKGSELKEHYRKLVVENLLESFKEVREQFGDIRKLQAKLKGMISGNPRYSEDLVDALELVRDKNGNLTFNIPLHNPTTTTKIQELLDSLWKSNVTKQKITGGAAILVSDFGFSNSLKVVRDSNGAIKEIECYMPAYCESFYKEFLRDNGTLDYARIERENPELLRVVGTRIPTEGKYSMLNLKIKGFLPKINGGAIMLPAEITQTAGSDFDVDKVFLQFPKFKVTDKNGKTTFEKYKYNPELSYSENSKEARDNEMIDIAYSILSNKAQAVHFSNPGSFNKIKRIARVTTILENPDYLNKYMYEYYLNRDSVKDFIMKAKLKDLDSFLKKYNTEKDILSPQTFIYNHQQNMIGAKLIGIYANNNSQQAKFQGTGLSLSKEYSFEINGREIRELDRVKTSPVGKDKVTELISKNCAEWLAASVDNVKDPVLATLLQNPNTANLTGFLLRGGMTIDEVGVFFKHPVIQFLINKGGIGYKNVFDYTKMFEDSYEDIINKNASPSLDTDKMLDAIMADNTLKVKTLNFLVSGPRREKNISSQVTEEQKPLIVDFYNMLSILKNKIIPASEVLGGLTRCCRADSPNGAIARTLPMAFNQKIRLDNFMSKSRKVNQDGKFPLENLGAMPNPDILKDNGLSAEADIDDIRRVLYSRGDSMMLQAFTTLGITAPIEIMSKWFTPFKSDILNMVSDIARNHDNKYGTVNDKTMNTIFNDFTTFILSKTSFFGNDGESTYAQKRDWYLYEFPKKFLDILSTRGGEYDAINSLDIIKKLRVERGEIVLRTGGSLTASSKDLLRQSLDQLMYLGPVSQQLAVDLFAYAYYSKGFRFDAYDYAQFFSTTFITTIGAEVIDALRDYSYTQEDLNTFKEQLYMNRFKEVTPSVSEKVAKGSNETIGSKIKLPLNLVYNNHMDDSEVINNDVMNLEPAVFPKLRVGYRYFTLDSILDSTSQVRYKKTNRFVPESLGSTGKRIWCYYNASQSAKEIADNYVKTSKQRDAMMEELLKVNSKKRKGSKVVKKSAIDSSKVYEYNGINSLPKEDREFAKNISVEAIKLASEDETARAQRAIGYDEQTQNEIFKLGPVDASVSEDSGELAQMSQYINESQGYDASTISNTLGYTDTMYMDMANQIKAIEKYTEEGEAKNKCKQ